jgi:hypothetical protein
MTNLLESPAMKSRSSSFALLALALLSPAALRAWDYEGHRIVNQLALASLPADFPAFVRAPAAAERVAFLAGEPDRWRNVPDLPIKQYNGIDHYCDLEQIPWAGLDFATLPSLRYDFAAKFAAGRAAHPDKFPPIDETKNTDHTREWCGFAPWAMVEYYGKLRAAFSYLAAFQETDADTHRTLGTATEIANAQANIIYLMGVMGHHVGDCAQPLHTTVHHNGWVGANPNGYSTWPGIHSWIDGGFLAKAAVKTADIAPRVIPAQPISLATREDGRDAMFVAVIDYVLAQNKLVEPLYQLEKAGKLGHGEQPITDEARAFIEGQLLKGGEMLGAIWLTAQRGAVPDTYLRASLLKRQLPPGAKTPARKAPAKANATP